MWNDEWTAISARIASLVDAATYFIRTIASGEHDSGVSGNELLRNAKNIVDQATRFQENYGSELPESARACLERFVSLYNQQCGNVGGLPASQDAITLLAIFRGEFAYLLSDTEALAKSLVTRAFVHLQRSIVADEILRNRWQRGFNEGEPACERLGACHLLSHGVWAFKAWGAGERTDLVLGVPLTDNAELRAAAEALVLTEWKVVRAHSELDVKARHAYEQARRYSGGILAGFELSSQRYLIIVSAYRLSMPASRREGSVLYQYINVSVSPSVPSAAPSHVSAV